MRISQRRAPTGFTVSSSSHLRIAQKTTAVKKADMAYTSPSTALNQKESENVNARLPMAPDMSTSHCWVFENFATLPPYILMAKRVMVQKRKRMVKELQSPLMMFTIMAA